MNRPQSGTALDLACKFALEEAAGAMLPRHFIVDWFARDIAEALGYEQSLQPGLINSADAAEGRGGLCREKAAMVSRMLEQAGHMTTPTDPGGALRRLAMSVVIMSALVLIFVDAVVVSVLGSVALVVFLVLAHRQFTIGTWVPVLLSALVLVLALWVRGVSSEVFLRAADRMIFLSALIAMLGCLRSAAARGPRSAPGRGICHQPTRVAPLSGDDLWRACVRCLDQLRRAGALAGHGEQGDGLRSGHAATARGAGSPAQTHGFWRLCAGFR